MEVFKHINVDTLNQLIVKERFTLGERFLIDSFTFETLVERCGDLKNNELPEVYLLEKKNLFALCNTTALLCGYRGDLLKQIKNIESVKAIIREVKQSSYSQEEKQTLLYLSLLKHTLSNFHSFEPIFEGQMPKKMFGFRQSTANTWFNDYINCIGKIAAIIYAKIGEDNAFAFTIANTAYYLNQSQTFKYYEKSTDKNMNDTIGRIVEEFYVEMSGGSAPSQQNLDNKILFKDL